MKITRLLYKVLSISVMLVSIGNSQTTDLNNNTNGIDDLFTDVPIEFADINPNQENLLTNYGALETTVEIKIVIAISDLLQSIDTVKLRLFNNESYSAVKTRVEQRSSTDFSWFGELAEDPLGSVIIVVKNDELTGSIKTSYINYAIRSLGDGFHVVIMQDLTNLPPEHPPGYEDFINETNVLKGSATNSLQGTNSDDGSTIDVLVAYTDLAKNATGDIEGLIQLAIDETNQSYQYSDIAPRLRLVLMYNTDYLESGFHTDLARFETQNDSYLDEVHAHRDNYGADVCVLIINNSSYCGLAYQYPEESSAFAAVHYSCATGYYSFAHEIGHIQGAHHNPEVDSNTSFPYGHGYVNIPPGDWRTIMAYNDSGCLGGYCTRIQNWSNPDIDYDGVPTGTITTHDNARVLDETALRVANFRVSIGSPDIPNIVYNDRVIDDDTIDSSVGDGDGKAEPGEEIELPVELYNSGNATAFNVEGILSTTDSDITITDYYQGWGDIVAGEYDWTTDFDFTVSSTCPEKDVTFTLDITSNVGSWTETFDVHIYNEIIQCIDGSIIYNTETSKFNFCEDGVWVEK